MIPIFENSSGVYCRDVTGLLKEGEIVRVRRWLNGDPERPYDHAARVRIHKTDAHPNLFPSGSDGECDYQLCPEPDYEGPYTWAILIGEMYHYTLENPWSSPQLSGSSHIPTYSTGSYVHSSEEWMEWYSSTDPIKISQWSNTRRKTTTTSSRGMSIS